MPTPPVVPQVRQVPSTVGARIRQLREASKTSVKSVADYCECTTQSVHAWEREDNPNIRAPKFVRLCQILNARAEYVLWGELPPHRPLPEDSVNMPVLNSSESPTMLNTVRAMERMHISVTLLRELGVAEPKRAAWYHLETDRHSPEWKAGDAFIIDRTEKPYKIGFWYLVVLGDRLDMRQVIGGDNRHLKLMDGAGKSAKRATDAVLYVGEVVTGWRRPASQWMGGNAETVAQAQTLLGDGNRTKGHSGGKLAPTV